MCKLKIDCDDCITWFVSDGVWTYDSNNATVISVSEAKQIISDMPNVIAKQHSVIVLV